MKRIIKLPVFILCLTIFAVLPTSSVLAAGTASNIAIDGGGAFGLLGGAGVAEVTITSVDSVLVKSVFNTVTTACIASSDIDGACGGSTAAAVSSGTALTMVIYVDNATALQFNDVQFDDILDQTPVTGFTYVGNPTYGTVGTGAAKSAILTAAQTNIQTPGFLDDFMAWDGTEVTVGGDGVTGGQNLQVDVPANTIWAIAFDVTKN